MGPGRGTGARITSCRHGASVQACWPRRAFIAGTASSWLIAATPVEAGRPATDPIAELERRAGGRLGLFAIDLATGRTLAHRANDRFKLMSTFKGLLTALVLRDVASGRERLDATVAYGRSDLTDASPVTMAHAANGHMTVGELCAAAMIQSDNAAANLLMRRLGGPARLTQFLREIGDPVTRIDDYEGHLSGVPMPADSTTPRAITDTVRRILLGPVLPPDARGQWKSWMAANLVGRRRLRAAFPAAWSAGDRTGTAAGVCNDYAFAERPGRAPLLVSAFYDAPGMELAAQEAVLREVGRQVIAWQA